MLKNNEVAERPCAEGTSLVFNDVRMDPARPGRSRPTHFFPVTKQRDDAMSKGSFWRLQRHDIDIWRILFVHLLPGIDDPNWSIVWKGFKPLTRYDLIHSKSRKCQECQVPWGSHLLFWKPPGRQRSNTEQMVTFETCPQKVQLHRPLKSQFLEANSFTMLWLPPALGSPSSGGCHQYCEAVTLDAFKSDLKQKTAEVSQRSADHHETA